MEKEIFKTARRDPRVKLLETIPGIGTVNASAIVATIGSGEQFKTGRDFAAWVGLTPLNKSSGGKERLGRISKMGNQYLRKLLVTGMTSRVRAAKYYPERVDPWTASILDKKPTRLATVAWPIRQPVLSGRCSHGASLTNSQLLHNQHNR